MGLEDDVLSFARGPCGLRAGARILVACSGGGDSLALLLILSELAAAEKWELAVAHLDHMLQPDSGEAAAFVRVRAAALGLPFYGGRVAVNRLASSVGRSPEDAARFARRAFLARAAREWRADAVALGHTADDQAETVVLNLIRGAGLRGFAAMPPRLGLFVRPLLNTRRTHLRRYLRARGVVWREDELNRDVSLLRNWVRHILLPAWERQAPGARERLCALAAAARDANVVVEKRAVALWEVVACADARGVRLADDFPAGVARYLIPVLTREAFARVAGDAAGLERQHFRAVASLLIGGAANLPKGVVARRDDNGVLFEKKTLKPRLLSWAAKVRANGVTALPGIGVTINFRPGQAPTHLTANGWEEVWLSPRAARGLVVRSWRHGDALRPVGLGGTKKLQDIFTDAKVPAELRSRWPVVAGRAGVLWVPGLALAEGVSAAPGGPAVRLTCELPAVIKKYLNRRRAPWVTKSN